jgi:hypothetical protein
VEPCIVIVSSRKIFTLLVVLGGVAGLGLACTPTAGGPVPPSALSCINQYDHVCEPDPGSVPVNCAAAEEGLEFFHDQFGADVPIMQFANLSPTSGNGPMYPGVRYFYSYGDGSAFTNATRGYQPASSTYNRCGDDPNHQVFHLSGGPFQSWGGGMGVAMEHLNQDGTLCLTPGPDYCPPQDNFSDPIPIATLALDMSKWEGVAVWARRGPDSQPLLRVLVGNKDTDDDVNYKSWQHAVGDLGLDRPQAFNCQRVRECACTYTDHPCTFTNDSATYPNIINGGGYYCGAPGSVPSASQMSGTLSTSSACMVAAGCYTNTCNTTKCNDPYPAYPGDNNDPQYVNRPCTPFTYRNGTQVSLCYDPMKDPPPANPDEQCGDFWTFPMHLTTDWQLFLIPFNQMFQQGWAKHFNTFDLHSITTVRLTWDAGFIDYWVDGLRFYRHKTPAQ